MPYEINHEKFATGPSLRQIYEAAKETPMPKLNVKVRKSDLRIIDNISRQSGTPRSQILNAMIESVIRKMLQDLAADDEDCAALIASYADGISGISLRSKESWSDVVFEGPNNKLARYYDHDLPDRPRDSFSDQFRTLAERLAKENQ
ncbi:TPA: hypothetical protein ACXIGC_000167 [Stenotrophomonas maltophilia]